MLTKDSPIEIYTVENGFIVRGRDLFNDHKVTDKHDCQVFRSMAELQTFLAGHFKHRANSIEFDA